MCCKCEIFFGFPPLQRFIFLLACKRIYQLPSPHNTTSCLSLLFSESFLYEPHPLLAGELPSLCILFMADILLLLVLQILPCLKQTTSPHWHKTSIMSHLPPTLKSFFITFKINWRCYYAKCSLLWYGFLFSISVLLLCSWKAWLVFLVTCIQEGWSEMLTAVLWSEKWLGTSVAQAPRGEGLLVGVSEWK